MLYDFVDLFWHPGVIVTLGFMFLIVASLLVFVDWLTDYEASRKYERSKRALLRGESYRWTDEKSPPAPQGRRGAS